MPTFCYIRLLLRECECLHITRQHGGFLYGLLVYILLGARLDVENQRKRKSAGKYNINVD